MGFLELPLHTEAAPAPMLRPATVAAGPVTAPVSQQGPPTYLDAPITVLWEMTQRCHLDCTHCYLGAKDFPDELNYEQAATVLEVLKRAGSFMLIMTGGEPTLHPDFDRLAQKAFALEFAPILFTAAGNLTPARRQLIGDLPWLQIEVSLLGGNGSHNRIARRDGAFERTLEDVAYWRSRGRAVLLKTVVWKDNREEIQLLQNIADELGCGLMTSPFMMHRTDTHATNGLQADDHDAKQQELIENLAVIEYLQRGASASCDGSLGGGIKIGPSAVVEHTPQQALLCGAGRKTWALAPNADVYPCNILRIPCGNLLKQPWEEIWFGPAMSGVRQVQVDDVHACAGCGVMSRCKRCPGQAWLETGDFKNRAQANCDVASARAIRAGDAITTPFPQAS